MRSDAVRWTLCAGIVAVAHALAWFALAMPEPKVDSDAGSPVVTLELSPVSAAPAQPPDEPQPEAQPDAEAAPAQPVAQEVAPPPPASPDPPPPAPEPVPDQTAIEQRPPPPAPPPEDASTPPLPPSELPLDTPPPAPVLAHTPPPTPTPPEKEAPPPPPTPERETPVVDTPPQPSSPPPSAPSVTALATADVATASSAAPGREEEISPAALRSWQRELIAQIERHKWFPASARGRSGVAKVAFSVDRDGRLMGIRIADSSGSAELDEAALDLIRRSQPFPAPPSAVREKDLNFVAPVRYLAPHASR